MRLSSRSLLSLCFRELSQHCALTNRLILCGRTFQPTSGGRPSIRAYCLPQPKMAAAQPEWHAPPEPAPEVRSRLPKLSVYNSLTRSKTQFVPVDTEGRKVGWYACGPTVYDDAFEVTFVLNITDVDDKIILAARQQYLLSRWLETHKTVDDEVQETTKRAFAAYVNKNLSLSGDDVTAENFAERIHQVYGHVLEGQSLEKNGPPGDKEAKIKMHINTSRAATQALMLSSPSIDNFALTAAGVLLPYIDSLHKHEVQGKDHEIFTKLTKRYEERFFDDMKALNVEYPDRLTRVTEYGPQIVDFVRQIQTNGFAYENDGSVYYDTTAWESSGGHYARLEPWNKNDKELQQDGEGSLSAKKTTFKRSAADFALWKASKEGEPSWDSPWGAGRPGWHIECSAMASDILGKQFDIHSGGIDLAFPHHDNELAQSEAYWAKSGRESQQWVNYFLHMGHLSIQGSKMSKSLKNFTTIREALAKGDWTPRGLRIVFLLGAWKDGLEITGEVVKAGVAWEERVNNFFLKVRDLQRIESTNESVNGQEVEATDLYQTFAASKERLHDALCDSFDTPTAMRIISDLITAFNTEKHVPAPISIAIGQWITDIVLVFGLDANHIDGQMGWSGLDIPEEAKTFIYPLSALRDRVREQAKSGTIDLPDVGSLTINDTSVPAQPYAQAWKDFQQKLSTLSTSSAPSKDYLAACDNLRDSTLWDLGIYLEDRDNQPALVRPLSASLRAERIDREAVAASRSAAKAKAAAEKEAADRERLEKGKMSPLDMFRTSEFSAWDEGGLPTKDAEGKEVAKSRMKKLKKDWERQHKAHEAWLAAKPS
nr:cysteine--trna ligase [Quercus suber]